MKKTTKQDNLTVDNTRSTFKVNTIPQFQVEGLIKHINDTKTNLSDMWERITYKTQQISKLEKVCDDRENFHKETEKLFLGVIKLLDIDNKFIKNLYDRHFKIVYFLMYSTAVNICFIFGIIIYLVNKH